MFFEIFTSDKRDFSPQQHKQHQTHVTALVLLVLTTLVVVFIALSMASPQPANRSVDSDAQDQNQQVTSSQMQQVSGTTGLPADLPIPESATITQNYRNDLTDDQTQRILVFQTSESMDGNQLADNLQTWATQHEFSVTQRSRTNGSGTMITERGGGQLIISWSQTQESTRVEINYVRM